MQTYVCVRRNVCIHTYIRFPRHTKMAVKRRRIRRSQPANDEWNKGAPCTQSSPSIFYLHCELRPPALLHCPWSVALLKVHSPRITGGIYRKMHLTKKKKKNWRKIQQLKRSFCNIRKTGKRNSLDGLLSAHQFIATCVRASLQSYSCYCGRT